MTRGATSITGYSFLFPVVLGIAVLLSGCAGPEFAGGGSALREPDGRFCTLSGSVRDEEGAVAGAIVRIQTTERFVRTAVDGGFSFGGIPCDAQVRLTAWAPGYFIAGGIPFTPGSGDVSLLLTRHTQHDNPDYAWLPSEYYPGEGENQGCAECHSSGEEGGGGTSQLAGLLPVEEWRRDAHSQSARNPRFLSVYFGTDLCGHRSPPTRYSRNRDYGPVPLPPDPSLPYFGPGYKLDFPDSDGNCGSCHIPIAALDAPYGVDPAKVEGVALEGVSCDFCHKIWDVQLTAAGLPAVNRPGILSLEFRRPEPGHQLFLGPLDDVAPGEDAYSPLQKQSAFCASCHFGVFWDTVVYNSYGEWLSSPYSDPLDGQTCQDCHMPRRGATFFALPDKGGLQRDPATIASHLMPGSLDEELLQNALTMTVRTDRDRDGIAVEVELYNDKTGHHVPTDSPLRHLILCVRLCDPTGRSLPLTEGPRLPGWTGDYADLPGVAYAKVLEELWTEISPSGAYWNQTRILSDNRLPAYGRELSRYRFQGGSGPLDLEVTLWYRRAFHDLMEQKGWNTPDILMEHYRARL